MSVTIKGLYKSTEVGRMGYGLMNLTWRPQQTEDEQAFQAIKGAIDAGSTMLNSGEFYGQDDPEANLKLLNRFFTKYPDYASKCFLSVKGAVNLEKLQPDCSTENLRKSVENINRLLGGRKRLDLFEPARVDINVPIEQVMKDLRALVEEGLFDYIGLSECSADTIRRAHAVAPISILEEEYSPFTLDMEENKVLETCKELGIVIAAYSPISRGLLSGTIEKPSDIAEGDGRHHFDRFQAQNWDENYARISKFKEIAARKAVTPAQLSLAWILKQWPEGFIPIPGSTRPHVVVENLKALDVNISDEEDKEIRKVTSGVIGGRYPPFLMPMLSR
ncbi:aldo/keto reductase [Atractiella rhizophila]|nr:aldo/keto reductase [Atractiella rhizophila]